MSEKKSKLQPDVAYSAGQLALDIVRGYAAHSAAIRVASQLDGKMFVRLIAGNPSDSTQRKDGTKWSFDRQDALVDAVVHQAIASELSRVTPIAKDAFTLSNRFDNLLPRKKR